MRPLTKNTSIDSTNKHVQRNLGAPRIYYKVEFVFVYLE